MPHAAALSEEIAVGTVFEVDDVPADRAPVVLTPTLDLPTGLRSDAILTVGSLDHVERLRALDRRGRVVVKLASTMLRYGALPGDLDSLLDRCSTARLEVVGFAIHLPLAGSDDDRLAEVLRWLPLLPSRPAVGQPPRARRAATPRCHRRQRPIRATDRHGVVARRQVGAATRSRRHDVHAVRPARSPATGRRPCPATATGVRRRRSAHGVPRWTTVAVRSTSPAGGCRCSNRRTCTPRCCSCPPASRCRPSATCRSAAAADHDHVDEVRVDHDGAADRSVDARSGRNTSRWAAVIGLDVTRAVALVGVVVMNYHGYLNGGRTTSPPTFVGPPLPPVDGVLSTRFAATFVLVAGMGVTLMTNRSRAGDDRAAIAADRWRLLRRGLLLYAFGLRDRVDLERHDPVLLRRATSWSAALIFTLRMRWLVLIGSASRARRRRHRRVEDRSRSTAAHSTSWLDPDPDSPREPLLRTFVGHTHPLLPWLAFFCAGIILGRYLSRPRPAAPSPARRAGSAHVPAATRSIVGLRGAPTFSSHERRRPRWRGDACRRGRSTADCCTRSARSARRSPRSASISWIAERTARHPITVALQHAGQMTLTLYLLHVLVFNGVVNWPDGCSPSASAPRSPLPPCSGS